MKVLRGWTIPVGLVLAATAANAQGAPQGASRPGYVATSDLNGPYAEAPPDAALPGNGPMLLPPREVYSVLRENGFSPLGAPRLRGTFYSIAALDRRGDDGHLVIDARNGQIVRFVPAYRDRFGGGPYGYGYGYGPAPMNYPGGPPRPPGALPREASRTPPVPLPRTAPLRPADDKPLAEKPVPQPIQQSAAVQAKAADTPVQVASPVAQAKPAAPAILPTQPMPKVQDLE
jgi:hypothetical protein